MTRKNTPLLCRSFCEQWYKACENDYFAPAPSGSPLALTFCSPDSVICSPLRDVAADGAALCTKLGFEVAGFPTEGDGEERDEEEDATQCYDGVPAAALLGPGPKPARSEGAYGSGGRPTWREFLRWLELRLARCVETLLPRPEFWLFLFLCFYFLGKVLAALRSLVDRAAFAGRNPQWRSQASPASAWTPDREGERDEARDEARDESGGVGWPRRLSGAKETVPTLFLPREGGNQTEASRRACEAAEARRAHQIGAPGACRVRSGFRKPSSLFGTSDDEEEVMSPEAVREMVGGR
ncbi:conserved hypothetical protein [Neospora caninum Liverpool]|nr:conserved hypothetical protein [Neospora caninum Liverpool]CBZ54441.1 conserved hypothetical protein [Neospora caninum Liverpool]|eukprot:XP_003884471.1 conserved hypothetical protein [Neospora caninum Liverpool]